MDLYVNPQITGFRQDVDGTIKELKIGSNKEDAYANIIEQGGKKLDNNKTATINVSTYTEPVEILPTEGKDGMKKATVTLSNIPSGGNKLYGWVNDGYKDTQCFTLTPNPTTSNHCIVNGERGIEYESITAVGEDTITIGTEDPLVCTRDSTIDLDM